MGNVHTCGPNEALVVSVTMYVCLFLGLAQPVIPKIIDVLLKNGTEPGKFMVPVDYYHVDEQKYYFSIVMYSYVTFSMLIALGVTNNIMLVSYVQHGSGIFAALRYANLIEESYRWTVFITIGLGMILVNLLGLQVLMNTHDLEAMTRFAAFVLLEVLYFYMECYVSQILIDHSISLRVYIYNSQWYRLSPKAQKLLQLMMMRSNEPCQLTAGNMLIMSVRTFGATFRTGLSYFMFARSTQGL